MTFLELYQQAVESPSPRQLFAERIIKATHASPKVVEHWLYGKRVPRREAREAIAHVLGYDVDTLFPYARSHKGRHVKKEKALTIEDIAKEMVGRYLFDNEEKVEFCIARVQWLDEREQNVTLISQDECEMTYPLRTIMALIKRESIMSNGYKIVAFRTNIKKK